MRTCARCGKQTDSPCIDEPQRLECVTFFPHSELLIPQPSRPLLVQREQTHGHFATNAILSQRLKRIFRDAEGHDRLRSSQQEALDAIAMKMSRILSGRADEVDHWRDIAGYATLIVKELEAEQGNKP